MPRLSLPTKAEFGLDDTTPSLVVALGTGRSYSQHNTVVYKESDRYRGMSHRNCILMHPDAIKTAGLQEHQRVTVQGDAGKLEDVEIICGAIRPGAAMMFYPEVNAILTANVDERSGTPAYKRVPVVVFVPA